MRLYRCRRREINKNSYYNATFTLEINHARCNSTSHTTKWICYLLDNRSILFIDADKYQKVALSYGFRVYSLHHVIFLGFWLFCCIHDYLALHLTGTTFSAVCMIHMKIVSPWWGFTRECVPKTIDWKELKYLLCLMMGTTYSETSNFQIRNSSRCHQMSFMRYPDQIIDVGVWIRNGCYDK